MALIEYALKLEPAGGNHNYKVRAEKRQGGTSISFDPAIAGLGRLVADLPELTKQIEPGESVDDEFIEKYGRELFEQVFVEPLRQQLSMDLSALPYSSDRERRYLSIRIDDPSPLSASAWDLLHWKHNNVPHFLGRHPQVAIVRAPFSPSHYHLDPVNLPLRILVVVSLPADNSPLNARAEIDALLNALNQMIQGGKIEVDFVQGAGTMARLRRAGAIEAPYDVIHFIGHGKEQDDAVHLVFEDDRHESHSLTWTELWLALQAFRPPRLVVLNVCGAAAASGGRSIFSSLANVFVNARIPAVVAHKSAITDEAAGKFSAELYRQIVEGAPLDYAFAMARYGLPGFEWQTPVLFLHSATPDIFTVPLHCPPRVVRPEKWIAKAKDSYDGRRWSEAASYAHQAFVAGEAQEARQLLNEGIQEERLDQCLHEMRFAAERRSWPEMLSWGRTYLKNERSSTSRRASERERIVLCEALARAGLGSADPYLEWRP